MRFQVNSRIFFFSRFQLAGRKSVTTHERYLLFTIYGIKRRKRWKSTNRWVIYFLYRLRWWWWWWFWNFCVEFFFCYRTKYETRSESDMRMCACTVPACAGVNGRKICPSFFSPVPWSLALCVLLQLSLMFIRLYTNWFAFTFWACLCNEACGINDDCRKVGSQTNMRRRQWLVTLVVECRNVENSTGFVLTSRPPMVWTRPSYVISYGIYFSFYYFSFYFSCYINL